MSNGVKLQMLNHKEKHIPNINDGFFVSPILGCTGGCSYCYLEIENYHLPRKNVLSFDELHYIAQKSSDFIWGQNGTIISIGAWGDIFPFHNVELTTYSVNVIEELLSWGNPVQIMSKNILSDDLIEQIANKVQFENQLLYSTTITSIAHWKRIEPLTASPQDRLSTCLKFKSFGIPTNVLVKPFIPGVTNEELKNIADLLLQYSIDYCTIGVMYIDDKIAKRITSNSFLRDSVELNNIFIDNYLDCNGEKNVQSSTIVSLIPHLKYLREKGICAFFKSSCVNSNVLNIKNPSNYYFAKSPYCISCGNCHKYEKHN